MSYSAIRAAAKTAVESVSNIGIVHNRLRLFTTKEQIQDNCTTTISGVTQIRFWTVSVESVAVAQAYFGEGNKDRAYMLVIRGYLGMDDSEDTEGTLFALAESVMDALDASDTLHGEFGGSGGYEAELAQLRANQVIEYVGYLCNHVEIAKQIIDRAGK